MILPRKQADAVACGRKTTHRIPVGTMSKGPKAGARFKIAYWTRGEDSRRSSETACWVEITTTPEVVVLHALGRDDARAEGYDGVRGPLNFRRAWLEAHDRAWIAEREDEDGGVTDEQVTARFAAKHDGTRVHLLTWRLCEEPSQFLAPVSGYTTNPNRAIDDLAVMGPTDAEVKRARELGAKQRAEFLRDLEAERKLRHGDSEAKRRPMWKAA